MLVKTLKYIVTSALFRLGKNASGKEYTWLEQVAIDYLSEKAPLDGNVSLKCSYYNLGPTARVASLPPDCMRISRVAVKSGNRVWTLTLDQNLRVPENIFDCADPETASDGFTNFWPGGWGWWNNQNYSLAGGRNVNYYRIVGRDIIFDHNVPDGQLVLEYLSNGSDLSGDSMINVTYAEPFRNYLMAQYCLLKGNREEKNMYPIFAQAYEAEQWNANILANADRMSEVIDAMAQSSSPHY